MLAGPLDGRVRWETATTTKDDLGSDVRSWSTSFETWCCEVRLSGAEQIIAAETVEELTVKLQIRWRPGLVAGPNARFVYDGKTYDVHSLLPIGRQDGWEFTGRTRADGADMPA